MKRYILLLCALFWAHAGLAAEPVTVEWKNPSEYTDAKVNHLDPDNASLNIRLERLARHLNKLATMHFKQGEQLHIVVTDYDMAGVQQADAGPGNRSAFTRSQFPNDFPSMTLSYTLKDKEGTVLAEAADVEITGRAIRTEGISNFPKVSKRDEETIGSEIKMLNRWFKETFLDAG
ncbi:hypothetical protein CWE15_10215 [Aliidiomarina taiwanensis]|uniref:DUF3016 domain-containing protein n=1 Tax=Aliidiomarina taiwanensis TaxID=946228 RepID=A0A432WYV8_9GAMM|nr:DUF3016 domain-containing protein [Aliidiomarina taiwanensis]RUO38871.1 hypothetical protein CWE15_10215 [Aliidiomarina taiwanensis]